ncbi:hypothetical protein BC332_23196 [Capsicum chinense]|nr:hypothetical protein BC332_23196 [Capsicum chinense]
MSLLTNTLAITSESNSMLKLLKPLVMPHCAPNLAAKYFGFIVTFARDWFREGTDEISIAISNYSSDASSTILFYIASVDVDLDSSFFWFAPSYLFHIQNRGAPMYFQMCKADFLGKMFVALNHLLILCNKGLVYGRISGIGRHTRKSDISSMLGISKLSPDDVRFEYNANYAPVAVMIQFPSRNAYEATLRAVVRKSGLLRMEMADRQKWDTLPRYDGKTILLLGVPRNALADDVERFLVGCQYDASSIQMPARQPRGFDRSPARAVLVEFPSQALATHAFITKNRGFCLNSQIAVRLLP